MEYLKLDEKTSYDLIKESARIAKQAVDIYLKENSNGKFEINKVKDSEGPRNVSGICKPC